MAECDVIAFVFFSSRGRHTRLRTVTGVQTCAFPIFVAGDIDQRLRPCGAAGRNDVGELHRRGHAFFRVVHRRQLVQPLVGHFRYADVHVALSLRRVVNAGHQLKESGFSAGREAYERRAQHESSAYISTLSRPITQVRVAYAASPYSDSDTGDHPTLTRIEATNEGKAKI